MAIQNARQKAQLRKEQESMEMQEQLEESQNGVEKHAPAPALDKGPSRPERKPVEAETLLAKRMDMVNGLNHAKAQREAVAEQLRQIEETVHHQEGAVMMLNELIQAIDPTLLQPQMGG